MKNFRIWLRYDLITAGTGPPVHVAPCPGPLTPGHEGGGGRSQQVCRPAVPRLPDQVPAAPPHPPSPAQARLHHQEANPLLGAGLLRPCCCCCCCCVASVVSDSVRPHRRQPTRLPRPWDSVGKNTGVGCHFLLQCMKVKSESEVAQLCPTLSDPMDCSPPGSSIHGIFQARVLCP